MVETGATEQVPSPTLGFYSRMFVIPKASGGWRLTIDLSPFNRFEWITKFRMETAASVLQSIREGDWMVLLDLKDAYFHIPIHLDSRKFLRFVWKGVVWQLRTLCFGLSTAPQVFTRVMASVIAVFYGTLMTG